MNDIFEAYPRPWRIDDNGVFRCATGEAFYVSTENKKLEAAIVECVNSAAQLAAAQERVRVLEDLLREVHGDNRAADLENGALYDPSSEFAQRIDAALAGTEPAKE